jgi:hypothetical protein
MARGDLNASQAGPSARGDALTDRTVEATILRVLNTKLGITERSVQQIQELTGLRGRLDSGDRPREAVRRENFGALARMAPMKSKQLGAAPTAADYNALRADIVAVYEALALIAQAIAQGNGGR